MSRLSNAVMALSVGCALAAAAASPVLAHSRAMHPGYNARAEAIGEQGMGPNAMGSRAAALRSCNKKVDGLKDYTWGVIQGDQYRACMTEHGQPE